MTSVSRQEIVHIGNKVVELTLSDDHAASAHMLKPLLDVKCPFAKLDKLRKHIGNYGAERDEFQRFLEMFDRIIDYNAMGSFVIVGQALIWFLPNHFDQVMEKSREYIIKGNKWYICDIIGERSVGHAVVNHYDVALPWLEKFLQDENTWVKRSAGVAIHFFSKKVLDQPEKTKKLLQLIELHIEETQIDVVKGIRWGLKTIGRRHPDILIEFLKSQIEQEKSMSRLLIRKAVTYLEEEKKRKILTLAGIKTTS